VNAPVVVHHLDVGRLKVILIDQTAIEDDEIVEVAWVVLPPGDAPTYQDRSSLAERGVDGHCSPQRGLRDDWRHASMRRQILNFRVS
jgi:hypothetical protein